MEKMEVLINTGTTAKQVFHEKNGSTLKNDYRQVAAVVYMDPRDMEKLSIKSGDSVDVKTKWGRVTLYAKKSHDAPHEKMIFIPRGPWSNIVVSPETYCCSVPTYKGIPGKISKSDKDVLLVKELIGVNYNKYGNSDYKSANDKPVYVKMR